MEETTVSSSFAGAKSTGDAAKDQERAEEMVTKVYDILDRQEKGDMTPSIDADRGPMWLYCRTCKIHDVVTKDVETEFHLIVCPQCGGKVTVGTEQSIRTYFHIK